MSLFHPHILKTRWLLYATAALAVVLAMAGPATAIQIDLTYRNVDSPSYDASGHKLMKIARAAADFWESYIHDDENISWEISWEQLDGNLGEHHPGVINPALIKLTTVADGDTDPWFLDDTPYESEEFLPFKQTLVRNLNPQHRDEAYSGGPPLLLEAGYSAQALADTAAAGKFDAFTVLFHEMGHALGMNWNPNDNDYDLSPDDVGGMNVGAVEADGYELKLQTALMNDFAAPRGKRTMASATDILATHDEGGFNWFNLPRVEYLGAVSDEWDNSRNWIGGAVPSGDEEVFVRNGGSVRLTSTASFAGSIIVDEGSSLLTAGGNKLIVSDRVQIGNWFEGTRGEMHIGSLTGSPWLDTRSLDIQEGLLNLASQGAILLVRGDAHITTGAMLMGAGFTEVQGTLTNNGEISAGTFMLFGFGGDLSLRAIDGGKLDLDGDAGIVTPFAPPTAGMFPVPDPVPQEYGVISAVNGNLRIASPLADTFNGKAYIGAGRTMTFAQPWHNQGELHLNGGATNAKAATLAGAEIFQQGDIYVEGIATISAPLATESFSDIFVRRGGRLNLITTKLGAHPNSTYLQGYVELEKDAVLNVDQLGQSWGLKGHIQMAEGSKVSGDELYNHGRIEGTGDLNVLLLNNSGTVAPTRDLRALNVPFYQTLLGRLEIDVDDFGQGLRYDVLRTGAASLAGALQIKFANDFLPAAGNVFDVLTASSITGAFSTLDIVIPDGVELEGQLIYWSDRVRFLVTHSAFEADFDSDGDVDSADLLAWKNSPQPDGNFFLRWQQQVGRSLANLPSLAGDYPSPVTPRNPAAVPEPSTATLAMGLVALVAAITRRRR